MALRAAQASAVLQALWPQELPALSQQQEDAGSRAELAAQVQWAVLRSVVSE